MATFTVPVDGVTPRVSFDPQGEGVDPLAQRLMRHFVGNPRATRNVFVLTDYSVVTEQPDSIISASGSEVTSSDDQILAAFWGGHGPQEVTAAVAAALQAAGYEVDA